MQKYNCRLQRLTRFFAAVALLALTPTPLVFAVALGDDAVPRTFQWTSSAVVIQPKADTAAGTYSVKDPSVVYANGKYHVFMTTADAKGWHIAQTSFTDWSQASTAPITYLDRSGIGPGYRAAPQAFYFAPQKLWYLIFQGGDPLYSTTANIDDPLSWSAPKPFFDKIPDAMKQVIGKGFWLDFWNICDDQKCYLFNTDDNGHLFRSETTIAQFPRGYGNTVVALQDANRDNLFEASMTYKVSGTHAYITMVEAMGPQGRYFRSWTSDRLDGEWHPMADSLKNPFAGSENVTFNGPAWSQGVSHGELVRAGNDQTMTINLCQPLQFLYQGLTPNIVEPDYIKLPYRLGLLTATRQPQLTAQCAAPAKSR